MVNTYTYTDIGTTTNTETETDPTNDIYTHTHTHKKNTHTETDNGTATRKPILFSIGVGPPNKNRIFERTPQTDSVFVAFRTYPRCPEGCVRVSW